MSGIEIIHTFATLGDLSYQFKADEEGTKLLTQHLRDHDFNVKLDLKKRHLKIRRGNIIFHISPLSPTLFFLSPYIYINGEKHYITQIKPTDEQYLM